MPARRTSLVAASLVAALLAPIVPARASAAGTIAIGIKGGANLANLYGDAVGNVEVLTARTGGGFIELKASPVVSFQVEALYAQKGAKETETLFDPSSGTLLTGSVTWRYDYVDVPALLKVTLVPEGSIRPSLFIGPVFSHLLKAGVEGIDLKDFTKTSDIGGTVGGNIDLGSGPARLVLDLRYTRSLDTFDKGAAATIFSRMHNTISAMVGLELVGG
jgi:hypothetical protein